MRLQGSALRLPLFAGEFTQRHQKPLYSEMVHRAHGAGLVGDGDREHEGNVR